MKLLYDQLKDRDKLIIWGTGNLMKNNITKIDPRLNIKGFCDSDSAKWDTYPHEDIRCFSKDELDSDCAVIIAIQAQSAIELVTKELNEKKIDYCHILDAVEAYKEEWEKCELEKFEHSFGNRKFQENKMMKFVNCHVPYKACNLKCSYCYIRQSRDFENYKMNLHSPEFIAKALSPQRLGGIAFINFCGEGETMMAAELNAIIKYLVNDGHYVQIVTNGTIDAAIDDLLACEMDKEKVFLKFSFHYKELVRMGKLEAFYRNIKRCRAAGVSVSVELVASDDLIPMIDEIKKSCMENLGALPHLTIPRDNVSKELKLLTNLSYEEYYQTWKSFESTMFQFKWENLNIPRFENCMAGKWSFWMDLESGRITKCMSNPYLDNIYDDISKEIFLEEVGSKCTLPYCYNCHAYLTFGLIEEVDAPTYFEVRNRVTKSGENWITETLRDIFEQKLYSNNRGNADEE